MLHRMQLHSTQLDKCSRGRYNEYSFVVFSYEVILDCWKECATERPSFSDLVTKISGLLEDIAGYVDFSATPRKLDEAFTTQSRDHLTESGKDHSDNSDLVIDKDLSHENSEIVEGGGDKCN